jgi:deoxycytidine triphosphate deaminase
MSETWEQVKDWVKGLASEHVPAALRRDAELTHLQALPEIPYDPKRPTGVLLSDQIRDYAVNGRMIEPFKSSKLKPAAYELSVGSLYSVGGKTHRLSQQSPTDEIVIKPFEVVIIQTLERLNLPIFLIARWNVRVKWAYEGLLWVGAAQVDAGYRGYLACPLYNLSNADVRLHYGEEIAVIDFVTTTPPTTQPTTERYNPYKRTRILFEDYRPNNLMSALATHAQLKIQGLETEIKELKARVDSSTAVIFTAIGILVAALALFVSGQIPSVFRNYSPSLLLSSLAVAVVLFLYARTTYSHLRADQSRRVWSIAIEIIAVVILVLILITLLRIGQHVPTPFSSD